MAEVDLWSLGELDAASTLGHPVDVRALTKTQNVATPRERSHVVTGVAKKAWADVASIGNA